MLGAAVAVRAALLAAGAHAVGAAANSSAASASAPAGQGQEPERCEALVDMQGFGGKAPWLGQLFLIAISLYGNLLSGTFAKKGFGSLKLATQMIFDRYERSMELCPVAVGLAALVRAEQILLPLLPLASSETPVAALDLPRREASACIGIATTARSAGAGDPMLLAQQGRSLLEQGLSRVQTISAALDEAGEEPWHGAQRKWVSNPFLWGCFNRFGRVTIVPLASTPWDFEPIFGSVRKHLRAALAADMDTGWRDIAAAMNIAAGGAEWWPIMGTLIGLLRYGRVHGALSEGKVDLVDDDVDLVVVLRSARAWLTFCVKLTLALRERGWLGCSHMLQERYHNHTQRLLAAGADLRGLPILVCARLGQGSDVLLNVYWTVPVLPVPAKDGAGCPRRATLGPKAFKCGGRMRVAEAHEVAEASLAEELFCPPGGGCWSVSTFFKHWPGRVLPAELRRPSARCEAFGSTTPCPRGTWEMLHYWSGGEYWRPPAPGGTSKWTCLALPDIACPDPSERTRSAWHSDRQGRDPRNRRLRAEGLGRGDVAILRGHQRRLLRRGLLAHNFSGCDWARCRARGAEGGAA